MSLCFGTENRPPLVPRPLTSVSDASGAEPSVVQHWLWSVFGWPRSRLVGRARGSPRQTPEDGAACSAGFLGFRDAGWKVLLRDLGDVVMPEGQVVRDSSMRIALSCQPSFGREAFLCIVWPSGLG